MQVPTLGDRPATVFLVERYWPGVTAPALAVAAERARLAADGLTRGGEPIEYVASLLLMADEVVFCLFRAGSKAVVVLANERAAFPFDRIVEGSWCSWTLPTEEVTR